jgi:hypothetical protein
MLESEIFYNDKNVVYLIISIFKYFLAWEYFSFRHVIEKILSIHVRLDKCPNIFIMHNIL